MEIKSFKEHSEELITALDETHTHWTSPIALKDRIRTLIIAGEYMLRASAFELDKWNEVKSTMQKLLDALGEKSE